MSELKPFYQEPGAMVYQGHAIDVLKELPAGSVDCVVTSPPYWGLRTYKTEPIIWGDNHCEHEWGDEEMLTYQNKPGQHWQAAYGGATGKNRFGYGNTQLSRQKLNEKHTRAFCLKCHAWKGELGLEPTIELYISHLLQIFDEVKRVLKETGTCWVNIDDSYASGKGTCFNPGGGKGSFSSHGDRKDAGAYPLDRGNTSMLKAQGLLPKSLCLIPQRFAIAMVESGWILRNDICWSKNNPMPESVKDRFTGSWEHLFFFTKSNKALYWTNSKTFKITGKQPPGTHGVENEDWEWIEHSACNGKGCDNKRCVNGKIKSSLWEGHDYWFEQQFEPHISNIELNPLGRNKRDVWLIPTSPYPEAHFATFPEKLCEIPILAGCPDAICMKCGMARERIYERTGHANKREPAHVPNNSPTKADSTGWALTEKPTNKYTDCGCNADFVPGITLDPFCGSGTAPTVAKKLGRKVIGIDLSLRYCDLTVKRVQGIPLAMKL